MMFLLTNLLLQGFLLYMLSKELRTLEPQPDSDLSGQLKGCLEVKFHDSVRGDVLCEL